jgi:hypothetical protein
MTLGPVFAALLAVVTAEEDPGGAAPDEEAVEEVAGAAAEVAEAPEVAAGEGLEVAPAGLALAQAAPVLIDRVERPGGRALERLVEASGEIVEHEVNRAGTVQSCREVGSLFTSLVQDQRPAAGGEVVQLVRDASGALLRVVVGADGEPRAVVVLAPPPR